ncbi:hypothetical protein PMAYCL1PPCAC_21092, partial [Pristionchus mayeri]
IACAFSHNKSDTMAAFSAAEAAAGAAASEKNPMEAAGIVAGAGAGKSLVMTIIALGASIIDTVVCIVAIFCAKKAV